MSGICKKDLFFAKVANYPGIGGELSIIGNKNYRNILKCSLGKYKVKLIQREIIFTGKVVSGNVFYTTDMEIQGVTSFGNGVNVINDICSLLSLAAISQVVPFEYSFKNTSKGFSVSRQTIKSHTLIEIVDANQVKLFLESTWQAYRRINKRRKLREVIDMLTYAEHPIQPLEIQLAQIFIILENLKATNANFEDIPFAKGAFRKISSPPKANLSKEQKLSFEELLLMMFEKVGMKPRLKRVKTLRNQIIHFGLSKRPYKSLTKHYSFCQDLIREYLLRLLNYHGEYLIYSHYSRSVGKLK